MKIIHYYSGVTLALFVGLHLLNHLMILHSEKLHVQFMKKLRKVYRNRIVESLLLLAVGIQIITGILLVTNKWPKAENIFDWVQMFSGLYLALFLIIHVTAVMIGRYKIKVDTNLYYGAGVMNMWPQKLIFIPYYTFAIISFFFHVACIHRIKMKEFVPLAVAEKQSLVIMIIGVIVCAAIIIKMTSLKDWKIQK